MVLCTSAGNFDPLIFVGVMPLGTWRTNNLSLTASDAGPDIIRSHLFDLISQTHFDFDFLIV